MSDIDRLVEALAEEGAYGPGAAERLEARLGREPSPRATARRSRLADAAMIACVALAAGAATGAVIEGLRPRGPVLLPASDAGSPVALLAEGG